MMNKKLIEKILNKERRNENFIKKTVVNSTQDEMRWFSEKGKIRENFSTLHWEYGCTISFFKIPLI